jgi:hypothetical protein
LRRRHVHQRRLLRLGNLSGGKHQLRHGGRQLHERLVQRRHLRRFGTGLLRREPMHRSRHALHHARRWKQRELCALRRQESALLRRSRDHAKHLLRAAVHLHGGGGRRPEHRLLPLARWSDRPTAATAEARFFATRSPTPCSRAFGELRAARGSLGFALASPQTASALRRSRKSDFGGAGRTLSFTLATRRTESRQPVRSEGSERQTTELCRRRRSRFFATV